MGNSRKHTQVGVTVDNGAVFEMSFTVTGSGGAAGLPNMTGSVAKSTDYGAVLTFPSGTYQADNGVSLTLPSGSFVVQLPKNSRYNQIYTWTATMESSASNYIVANAINSGISQFEVQQYYHSAVSGTYIGGFIQPYQTGSAGVNVHTGYVVGGVPYDRLNPNSHACTVHLSAFVRNTDRKV